MEGYCFDQLFRCNGVYDCPGREDEAGCSEYSCPGMYRCRDSAICLNHEYVCDNFVQCPQYDDELFCNLACPVNCTCYGLSFTCPSDFSAQNFTNLRYLDASGSGLTTRRLKHNVMLIYLSLARCGLYHLGNITLPNLRSLELSNNNIRVITVDDLGHVPQLQTLILAGNPLTSTLLSSKELKNHTVILQVLDLSRVALPVLNVDTHMPYLQSLNLSGTGLDHLQGTGFQSLSNLRVIDLRGCPLSHFPHSAFGGLAQLRTMYADSWRLCCRAALPVGFNPLDCHAPEDIVSSCERLLKNVLHVVLVSMYTTAALVGNVIGFVLQVFIKTEDSGKKNVLLPHLHVSDFLMGMYLVFIAMADHLYQGHYLWEDISWRNGVACKSSAFFFLLSSVMSPCMVSLVTVEKLIKMRFPNRQLHSTYVHVAGAISWAFGFLLALVLILISNMRLQGPSGICIPILFTEESEGFYHGVTVIFPCVLYSLVAVAQIYIYIKSRPNIMAALDSDRDSSEERSARRFLPVALCGCVCRMSLGMLAWPLSHAAAMSQADKVTATVLALPFTSALHPLFYAYSVLRERQQHARDKRLLHYLVAKKKAQGLNARATQQKDTKESVASGDRSL